MLTDHDITLTVRREPEQDISVLMRYHAGYVPRWTFEDAVDAHGNPALLTWDEKLALQERASHGEDETGR